MHAAGTDASFAPPSAAADARSAPVPPPDAATPLAPLTPHAAALTRKRQADERVHAQSLALIVQARQLDTRLNAASQTDRQLARRAASLVTQLARRLSVLLSRTASLLPMLPGHGGRRINHYVVHAERAVAGAEGAGRVRMLTIGSNGMLRVGSTERDATGIVWVEYDPFAPAADWDLETVIERLTGVVLRVEGHVDAVESRVLERARVMDALSAAASRKPSAPAHAPPPSRHPISPLLSLTHGAAAGGGADRIDAELSEALQVDVVAERAREQEIDDAMAGAGAEIFPHADPVEDPVTDPDTDPTANAPAPGSLEDAQVRYERSRKKRQMFDRLR